MGIPILVRHLYIESGPSISATNALEIPQSSTKPSISFLKHEMMQSSNIRLVCRSSKKIWTLFLSAITSAEMKYLKNGPIDGNNLISAVPLKLSCLQYITWYCRTDSRFVPCQWEMPLQSNGVSHWLGTNQEPALCCTRHKYDTFKKYIRLQTYERQPGDWFNMKTLSYQYRKSHCGDKMTLRPSYLHNGISYTGKMASSYWIRAQYLTSICSYGLSAVFKISLLQL